MNCSRCGAAEAVLKRDAAFYCGKCALARDWEEVIALVQEERVTVSSGPTIDFDGPAQAPPTAATPVAVAPAPTAPTQASPTAATPVAVAPAPAAPTQAPPPAAPAPEPAAVAPAPSPNGSSGPADLPADPFA